MVRKAYAGTPRRLGIIYNAQSGRHRRRWGHHPLPADVLAIEANTPAEITHAVARLAADGVGLIAVAGGDGTVQCVLGEILLAAHFAQPPELALIPTGSTNMTASDAGFVDVRHHGWQPLCDWAAGTRAARVRERDVLCIDRGPEAPRLAGMFFGAGAIHHAVAHTQKRLHGMGLRGQIGPALAFVRFVKSILTGDQRYFAPVAMQVHDDAGRAIEGETLLPAVSTLRRLVLRFRPFWGTEPAPIAWTLIAGGAQRLLGRLPGIVRGGRGVPAEAGYVSHNSRRLRIALDGGFIVDGEFFDARGDGAPIEISIAGRLSFVAL